MSEWISVKDRLPAKWLNVLTYRVGIGVQTEYVRDDDGWKDDNIYASEVTHWMPLPEPPKED